ncbi:F-type H+-transporting ATPase subunit b [Mariprofundus ferrinatatus]|uniref:ATP synthase subunit b n=1 Tax=Mariprofundus ferrinatatus TaxID=1921087 RepID=A0A2K8L5Y9_9PROT|nr:F0F1 ATP synthase subunit B [Mariprofundus ferrinatatus]ATX82653.1 F-type H+-transporting ATPase subunit b [Mariprofundus ferrinatatus]
MSIDLTFIGQIVVFLTLVFLMKKYLYGPMADLMEARSQKIADGLAAADAGKEAKAKAEAEIAEQLKVARTKASEVIASAEKRAAEINEAAVVKAREEAQQIVDSAREEVNAELNRARQTLRSEVADIAMLAAERVVESELDAKRHAKLVEGIVSAGFGNA